MHKAGVVLEVTERLLANEQPLRRHRLCADAMVTKVYCRQACATGAFHRQAGAKATAAQVHSRQGTRMVLQP